MFPDTLENFGEIHDATYNDLVEGEMTDLNNKIDALPTNMKEAIVSVMYGKMQIHDDTMDIYDRDGTLITTFDLYDHAGYPTTSSAVYKREIKEPDPVSEP
jgi:hypothetical protein